MRLAQRHQPRRQRAQLPPGRILQQRPVHPARLVVLAVRVVVAALRPAELVARHQHRHPRRQQQRRQQVAQLPAPQHPDPDIVRLALRPAVPRPVVVGAVPARLPVGLVVLALVRHQVAQGETVVGGHEVHRGVRPPPAPRVQVARPRQPVAEVPYVGQRAPPEVPHRVPVAVVPLRPQRGEGPHLVAARAHVPRLGDQLHPAQHRVLRDDREERREHVHVVHRPGQRRRQVEPEAVHPHLRDPVPQRVRDQPQHVRPPGVQGVPAARVVGVAPLVGLEPVVAPVVDAAQRQRRAQLARLRRVVVDHVEDDLDPRRVQGPHHPLELADLLPGRTGRGVPGVRGEVADGVVAPVVAQAPAQQVVLVRELVHRQQLDRGHPEPRQVLDRRRVGEASVGAAQLLGNPGMAHREPAHVQLVDDRVRPGRLRPDVVRPVVVIVDHDPLGDERRRVAVVAHGVRDVLLRPVPHVPVHLRGQDEVAVDGPRVRVQQQLRRIEPGARPGVPAAVHPEPVALPGPHAGQEAVPDLVRELGQCAPGLGAVGVEEAHLHRLRALRPQREVGARRPVRAGPKPRPQRVRGPRPHRGPRGPRPGP